MNKLWMGIRIAFCTCPGVLVGGTVVAEGSEIQLQWLVQSATRITSRGDKVEF